MAQQAKSIALLRALKEKLKFRFPSKTFVDSFDSAGNPILVLAQSSTPAVGEDNLLIKIKPIADDIARKDALGLDQRVFTPHVCQMLRQKNATTTVTTLDATLCAAVWEEAKNGVGLEIYDQADATNAVVADSQFAAAVKLTTLRDIQNPLIGEV